MKASKAPKLGPIDKKLAPIVAAAKKRFAVAQAASHARIEQAHKDAGLKSPLKTSGAK